MVYFVEVSKDLDTRKFNVSTIQTVNFKFICRWSSRHPPSIILFPHYFLLGKKGNNMWIGRSDSGEPVQMSTILDHRTPRKSFKELERHGSKELTLHQTERPTPSFHSIIYIPISSHGTCILHNTLQQNNNKGYNSLCPAHVTEF